MSDPILSSGMEIDNLGNLTLSWNNIEFECISKGLPYLKESQVWFVRTDRMSVGRAVVGTSEGFEAFELSTPFNTKTYRDLLKARLAGEEADAIFTYNDGTGSQTITVPDCKLTDVSPDGSDLDSAGTLTVKLQPKGGILKTSTDSPIVFASGSSSGSGSGSGSET